MTISLNVMKYSYCEASRGIEVQRLFCKDIIFVAKDLFLVDPRDYENKVQPQPHK